MRKVNYKGRCTKRKLSKCKDVCRTFDEIQLKVADMLQANDDIKAFRCNVCLEGVENNLYMSDLVAEKSDGKTEKMTENKYQYDGHYHYVLALGCTPVATEDILLKPSLLK